MSNKEKVVRVLKKLSAEYKLKPDKKFQLRAVQTAVRNLMDYEGDISSGKDASKKVKGVGKGMIRRIDEILDSGDLAELEGVSGGAGAAKRANKGEKGIIHVTGIGPVKAKKLADEGYHTIDELVAAVNAGKVKLTHHQQIGVKYYEDFLLRIPRTEMMGMEKIMRETLVAIGGGSNDYILEICGSYRRGREDCGDIDVLMTYRGMKGMNSKFVTMYVKTLMDRGFIVDNLTTNIKTKYMGVCKLDGDRPARRIDIRAVPYQCFYPALIYFTGSKEFNIEIRKRALELGFSLSEYGFKEIESGDMVTCHSENEIFDKLGIEYVAPVDR